VGLTDSAKFHNLETQAGAADRRPGTLCGVLTLGDRTETETEAAVHPTLGTSRRGPLARGGYDTRRRSLTAFAGFPRAVATRSADFRRFTPMLSNMRVSAG
jgi:hypothetical protein